MKQHSINVKLFSVTFCLLLIQFSCKSNKDKNAIARVYDKYLYAEDVKGIVPNNMHGKDSLDLIKLYIDNWIQKSIVLRKAENNLSDVEKNVEQQLEDYRTSLITYLYEKALVSQKLDTSVSATEIEKYYAKNSTDFELKDNIIKVWYVKIEKQSPVINRLKNLYKINTEKNKKSLEDLCTQYAENYYFKEDAWLLFDDLLKEIPIKTYDKEQYLQNNRHIEFTDAAYIYLVNIIDFKIKESVSPLAYETTNIRNIILNKRKLQLIENMKKELKQEAESNKEIEVY